MTWSRRARPATSAPRACGHGGSPRCSTSPSRTGLLADQGVGAIPWICFSPIEQGILTGKYKPGQPVPQDSRATDAHGSEFIKSLLTDEMLTRVQRLAPLAEAEDLTMAQMAVAWVLQNDNVASAITGGSRPEQIKANAAAAGKTLSSETLAGIDEALGDAVQRDGSLVGDMSPKQRPT